MSAVSPLAVSAPLLTVNLLAGAVWVGSLVALAVVTRAARETLDPRERVAFFRALGRRYAYVGTLALLIAIASGAALLAGEPWSGSLTVLVALVAALLAVTGLGMRQARRVNRLRAERHARGTTSDDTAVRGNVRRADMLRLAIAVLTLAIVVDVAIYVSGS